MGAGVFRTGRSVLSCDRFSEREDGAWEDRFSARVFWEDVIGFLKWSGCVCDAVHIGVCKAPPRCFSKNAVWVLISVGPIKKKWCLVFTKHHNTIPFGKRGTHHVAKRVLYFKHVAKNLFPKTGIWVMLNYIHSSYLDVNAFVAYKFLISRLITIINYLTWVWLGY